MTKKIGILGCQTFMQRGCPGSDVCWKCFNFAIEKKGQFSQYGNEPIEIVAMANCGGCPGNRIVKQGVMLANKGAEIIHLAGCYSQQEFPCPYVDTNKVKEEIEKKTQATVVIGVE